MHSGEYVHSGEGVPQKRTAGGGGRCIKCAILERMYDFRAYEWPLSVMPRNYNNCSRSSIDYKKRSNNEKLTIPKIKTPENFENSR